MSGNMLVEVPQKAMEAAKEAADLWKEQERSAELAAAADLITATYISLAETCTAAVQSYWRRLARGQGIGRTQEIGEETVRLIDTASDLLRRHQDWLRRFQADGYQMDSLPFLQEQ